MPFTQIKANIQAYTIYKKRILITQYAYPENTLLLQLLYAIYETHAEASGAWTLCAIISFNFGCSGSTNEE